MGFIKTSSWVITVLLIIFYILSWVVMPNLLPQPPEIVCPIGSMFWFSSLNKDTQQMIGILLLLSQLILLIAALAYIANFVLRIKKHVWDKWFVAVTLLLLP